MTQNWGYDYEQLKLQSFDDSRDRVYAFNSSKKRSTAIVHQSDGSVRLYCKGASEYVLRDCTMYMDSLAIPQVITPEKMVSLEEHITCMAEQALRTLLLAHKDYPSPADLPSDWQDNPPDNCKFPLPTMIVPHSKHSSGFIN